MDTFHHNAMVRIVKWLETHDIVYVNDIYTINELLFVALDLGLVIINGVKVFSLVYIHVQNCVVINDYITP